MDEPIQDRGGDRWSSKSLPQSGSPRLVVLAHLSARQFSSATVRDYAYDLLTLRGDRGQPANGDDRAALHAHLWVPALRRSWRLTTRGGTVADTFYPAASHT